MDFWVVAAAAGAGYLARYWNRILKIGDGSCGLSSVDSYFENPESPSCSFPFPKQAWRDKLGKHVSLDRRGSDVNSPDGLWTAQVSSDRGFDGEKITCIQNFDESNVLSISNLSLSLLPNDSFKYIEHGNEHSSRAVGSHGFFPFDSSADVVHISNSSGNRTSLRSNYLSGHICRPLNSLESCFMAQLYNEHAKMEEYVFHCLSSPSMTTRPFLVSDGSRLLSRGNDSFSPLSGSKEYKLRKEACQVRDENQFEVPSLLEVGSSNDIKKMKFYGATGQSQRSSSSDNSFREECIRTQLDATYLFSLGISFGIIFSILENKREMDELRDLLKQTEYLIEDLQEELDMKDSMTVKELHYENYGSHDICEHSLELNGFSPERHSTPKLDRQESYDQREEERLESVSKIEAELEAELERLGLDMNASSLERKLSELVELDPEFSADFARGELRADFVNGKDFINANPNEDADDNYGVPPHELSLRLHEVVESQLEERVKELETALENSQRKVQLMESEHKSSSQKSFSITGGNILTYETYEDSDPMHQPLILNLSGEALDAYNEAYEELIKMDDSKEDSPLGFHGNNTDHKESSFSHDWHALGFQHGGDANGSITCCKINGGKVSRDGQSESIRDINVGGDASSSYDNEVERQLIRQIVEKSKKGSPVFQNAQRILHSMYEDEH